MKAGFDGVQIQANYLYLIAQFALDRHARGEAADPLKDWLEAERQLSTAV